MVIMVVFINAKVNGDIWQQVDTHIYIEISVDSLDAY